MATAITTRVATVDDFPWIIELIDRNRAEQLSEQQRATAGFVQGRWNTDTLQQLLAGPGMFIAEVDGIRAGVALSSSPGAVTTGPAGRTNELAADHFGDTGYFLYGPVVVDADFRGQGCCGTWSTVCSATRPPTTGLPSHSSNRPTPIPLPCTSTWVGRPSRHSISPSADS
ncbi:hypothetical protein [Flexivirga alba]|uniref:N-acetyltransferase domain-containing protein n=1 Tax=Flexivirga alba TaxID=702742 RepID=A0ABW2ABM2_9MICO